MRAAPEPSAVPPLQVLEVVGNAIVGGMEAWVQRFVAHAPAARCRFTALLPAEGPFADALRSLGTEVVVLPMPDNPPWVSIQAALGVVRARGIEVLHAHLPRAHLLAGLVGRLAHRPVLATVHGRELSLTDLEVHRAAGTHLSVVCRQSRFHALGLGVDEAFISCIPNGVDTTVFQPRPRSSAAGLRGQLGLEANALLVGFVGRLSPEKGPEVFIRAMAALAGLAAGGPPVHAVIAGDGPLQATVDGLIAERGLQGRVHRLGLCTDMPALYAELDVLVSTSWSEAMPLALMEALASGLPVVATRVGGVPDLIEHGQNGWLVAPGDAQDVAGRCAGLLADAAGRARMGRQARERAVARLDLRPGVARMVDLLWRLGRPAVTEVAGHDRASDDAAALPKLLRQS